MKETIGFLGSGRMGQPMALNLLQAGYALRVYNRTASKTEPLVAQGAEFITLPGEVPTASGIVVSMVTNDKALEEIVLSAEFLQRLGQGGIHLSMSTIAPATAHRMAELHAQYGSIYLDAPVFGVPQAAAAQKLWICLAGEQSAKERVRPLLESLGQGIFDFGETSGSASLVKLSGNFISFAAIQALREVLILATKSGVDPFTVVDMFTQVLFPISIYQHFGRQLASNPDFLAGNWIALKDIGLLEETMDKQGVQAPLTRLLYDLLYK